MTCHGVFVVERRHMQVPERVTKVRTAHLRLYAFEEGVALATKRNAEGYKPLPKGGETRVSLFDEAGNVIASGQARCSASDSYNRRLGRTIALGRALKNVG